MPVRRALPARSGAIVRSEVRVGACWSAPAWRMAASLREDFSVNPPVIWPLSVLVRLEGGQLGHPPLRELLDLEVDRPSGAQAALLAGVEDVEEVLTADVEGVQHAQDPRLGLAVLVRRPARPGVPAFLLVGDAMPAQALGKALLLVRLDVGRSDEARGLRVDALLPGLGEEFPVVGEVVRRLRLDRDAELQESEVGDEVLDRVDLLLVLGADLDRETVLSDGLQRDVLQAVAVDALLNDRDRLFQEFFLLRPLLELELEDELGPALEIDAELEPTVGDAHVGHVAEKADDHGNDGETSPQVVPHVLISSQKRTRETPQSGGPDRPWSGAAAGGGRQGEEARTQVGGPRCRKFSCGRLLRGRNRVGGGTRKGPAIAGPGDVAGRSRRTLAGGGDAHPGA